MDYMVKGKTLGFRPVTEDDAAFILELRQNENLGKYLSATDINLEQQKEWIRSYKIREVKKREYYFRVDTLSGESLGFLRIYNIDHSKKTFTWGSWILKETHPKTAAIECAIMIFVFLLWEWKNPSTMSAKIIRGLFTSTPVLVQQLLPKMTWMYFLNYPNSSTCNLE